MLIKITSPFVPFSPILGGILLPSFTWQIIQLFPLKVGPKPLNSLFASLFHSVLNNLFPVENNFLYFIGRFFAGFENASEVSIFLVVLPPENIESESKFLAKTLLPIFIKQIIKIRYFINFIIASFRLLNLKIFIIILLDFLINQKYKLILQPFNKQIL